MINSIIVNGKIIIRQATSIGNKITLNATIATSVVNEKISVKIINAINSGNFYIFTKNKKIQIH